MKADVGLDLVCVQALNFFCRSFKRRGDFLHFWVPVPVHDRAAVFFVSSRFVKSAPALFGQIRQFQLSTFRERVRRGFRSHQFHSVIARDPGRGEPGMCPLGFRKFFVRSVL